MWSSWADAPMKRLEKPLPNRTTIVIFSTKNYDGKNCMTARSVAEAIEMAGDKDIYISGGARVYEEALPLVEKMYITEVDLEGMQTIRTLARNMSFLMKSIAWGKEKYGLPKEEEHAWTNFIR